MKGRYAPPPALKPAMAHQQILLNRPNLGLLAAKDPSLTTVIEARRSLRRNSQNSVSLDELAEFLYRVARVRSTEMVQGVELSNRPYPNGGASYELEIYPVVGRCVGLLPGVYHYDPQAHALEPLVPENTETLRLIVTASSHTAGQVMPHILLVITARFQRVSYR